MPKAEWYAKNQRMMVEVKMSIVVSAETVIGFVIETMVKTGRGYFRKRTQCLSDMADRFVHNGLATKLEVTDDDRKQFGSVAESYAREVFPDLFETRAAERKEEEEFPLTKEMPFLELVEEEQDGKQVGQGFVLLCPICGDKGQTTGAPIDDGTTYSIPMEGDCRHRWILNIKTVKGRTYLFAGEAKGPAMES